MKTIHSHTWLCLLGFIMLTACEDDTITTTTPSSGQQVNLGRSCELYTLPEELTLDDWQVSLEGEWMTPLDETGKGGTPLQVYIEENSEPVNRVGRICLSRADGSTSTIDIHQLGRAEDNQTIHIPGAYEKIMGVGWGYDCNTYYGNSKGVRDQIFNPVKIQKLAEKFPGEQLITDENISELKASTSVGMTSQELSKALGIEAGVGVGIPFAFSVDVNARFEKNDMQSSNRSFAIHRHQQLIKRRYMGVENIMALHDTENADVFTYGFKHALERLKSSGYHKDEIRNFVNTYGNTIVTRADIGGCAEYNMTVDKSRSTSTNEITVGVEVGFLSAFSISVSETQKEIYDKIQENSKYTLTARAGDVTLLAKAMLGNGDKCPESDLKNWLASIKPENAEMVDCQLIPIWEILPDERARLAVRTYITGDRISEKDLTFPEPTSIMAKADVPEFSDNPDSTLIKLAQAAGSPFIEFCREYIPTLDLLNRVTVAYPIRNNRPDYRKGIFIGDGKGHQPGYIYHHEGKQTYSAINKYGPYETLKQLYLQNFELYTEPQQEDNLYIKGESKSVTVKYQDQEYPIVKIDTTVWFRHDLQATKFRIPDIISQKNPIYFYYQHQGHIYYTHGHDRYYSDRRNIMPLFCPPQWELPSNETVDFLLGKWPSSRENLYANGLSGLDLSEVGHTVYISYSSSPIFESIDNGHGILITPTNYCDYTLTSHQFLKETISNYKGGSIRPVRAWTFTY